MPPLFFSKTTSCRLTIQLMDMNGTALNGVQLPKRGRSLIVQTNPERFAVKEKVRCARLQYSNRLAASQSSQRATLRKGQSLHCFVRAFAIHADAIIPATLFLSYKMTGDRPVFWSSQKQHKLICKEKPASPLTTKKRRACLLKTTPFICLNFSMGRPDH
jgi:hypothetical protein